MENVSFDEEQLTARRAATSRASGLTGLVIRWGMATDEKTAAQVLIVSAVCLLALAIGIFMLGGTSDEPPTNPYAEGTNVVGPPPLAR